MYCLTAPTKLLANKSHKFVHHVPTWTGVAIGADLGAIGPGAAGASHRMRAGLRPLSLGAGKTPAPSFATPEVTFLLEMRLEDVFIMIASCKEREEESLAAYRKR